MRVKYKFPASILCPFSPMHSSLFHVAAISFILCCQCRHARGFSLSSFCWVGVCMWRHFLSWLCCSTIAAQMTGWKQVCCRERIKKRERKREKAFFIQILRHKGHLHTHTRIHKHLHIPKLLREGKHPEADEADNMLLKLCIYICKTVREREREIVLTAI